jgi:hypothetical protein
MGVGLREALRVQRMNIRDRIGKRGQSLFTVIIGEWCDGKPWFDEQFMGDKREGKDFTVELIEPTSRYAMFQVQVKATRSRYRGVGVNRKLWVSVPRRTVERLQSVGAPAYVVDIDIDSKQGFIKAITPGMTSGFSGIPTAHLLDCPALIALWHEVDAYWATPTNRTLNIRFM